MRALLALPLAGLFLLYGTDSQYLSARHKIGLIESDTLRPGTRVVLSQGELNSYVQREIASVAPRGIRQPSVGLSNGGASGAALIDFGELQRAQGNEPGWLMSKLLDGERPVRVSATIQSANGRAVVNVQRVEISGIAIEGATLDYLIRNYLMQYYPEAKVGRPFELGHHIERLEVQPSAVAVVIGR
ncbi:MAG: hypothetical protein M1541_12235 [Acidobacteria bacterium]|nr:hypothetical protein [Acidobacteriota bacterium]